MFKKGLDKSQIDQPIKKKKFSFWDRSRPQEIWERDYLNPVERKQTEPENGACFDRNQRNI